MSWQYIVFTFMAGFPAVMWVVGQIMEQRSKKRGTLDEDCAYEPGVRDQIIAFIAGVCSISTLIGLAVGSFGYPAFVLVGVISFVITLVCFKFIGVYETILRG